MASARDGTRQNRERFSRRVQRVSARPRSPVVWSIIRSVSNQELQSYEILGLTLVCGDAEGLSAQRDGGASAATECCRCSDGTQEMEHGGLWTGIRWPCLSIKFSWDTLIVSVDLQCRLDKLSQLGLM